jgi:long-chain acyl-CoA synthetase
MHLNLGTILRANAYEKPEAPVMRMGDMQLGYAEVDRAAAGVAASLLARGISPGEKVALLVPNVPEFTIAYFGILYAGATVVPINVLASAAEVSYFLKDSGARLLIAHPLFLQAAEEGARPLDVSVVIASSGDEAGTLGEMAAAEPLDSPHATAPQDTAVIL